MTSTKPQARPWTADEIAIYKKAIDGGFTVMNQADNERWQRSALATIDALTAENGRLKANQRTPGTAEECTFCRLSERYWDRCGENECPIRAAKETAK